MPTLTRKGRTRTVKNLDWLIRHQTEVVDIDLYPHTNGSAHMVCRLFGGGTFTSDWADYAVCCAWLLNRRHLKTIVPYAHTPTPADSWTRTET